MKYKQNPSETNHSRFNDPIALKTEWKPMTNGGANFQTHKLRQVSDSRVEFDPTFMGVGFSIIFILTGLFVFVPLVLFACVIPLFSMFSEANGSSMQISLSGGGCCGGLFGLLFIGLGYYMFSNILRPIVFDLDKDRFWKGLREPAELDNKTSCSLDAIHAIQLIGEWNKRRSDRKDVSFYSYELNLVLPDGNRIHAVEHGDLKQIWEDAKVLGTFLNKPVWDDIESKPTLSTAKSSDKLKGQLG